MDKLAVLVHGIDRLNEAVGRGVAPPQVTTGDIYRGILPFVLIQLLGLCVIAAFPGLATWLPKVLF